MSNGQGLRARGSSEPLTALRSWKTVETRDVFSAMPWLKVSVERIELPDGRAVDDFYKVYMPDSILVFARTGDGRAVVERAYRHGIGRVSLVFPTGGIGEGEEPLEAAKRELLEETGYAADRWRAMGSFVANGNQGCGRIHQFQAEGAHKVKEPDGDDLEQIQVVLMTDEELTQALAQGEIVALSSVTAIGLVLGGLLGSPGSSPRHPGADVGRRT